MIELATFTEAQEAPVFPEHKDPRSQHSTRMHRAKDTKEILSHNGLSPKWLWLMLISAVLDSWKLGP